MLREATVPLMRCPTCSHPELHPEVERRDGDCIVDGKLGCPECTASYPVTGGIPDMIPRALLTGEQWDLWQDHLEGLQARREQRQKKPDDVLNRLSRRDRIQRAFAGFIGLERGRLLDVGCGPGKFRLNFDRDRVAYHGIDPVPLPEIDGFDYVRGVAEHVPFQDGTFTDAVVLNALDHFKDPESFLVELVRVLEPGGRFHLLQVTHDVRGPVSAVKFLAHELKDALESRATKLTNPDAPKHMTEYKTPALRDLLEKHFTIVAEQPFNARWYRPTRLFLTLQTPG